MVVVCWPSSTSWCWKMLAERRRIWLLEDVDTAVSTHEIFFLIFKAGFFLLAGDLHLLPGWRLAINGVAADE